MNMTEQEVALLIARINHLCKLKNVNRTTAFVESGVGKNFKSNLSTSNPSMGKITMLANYFGVPVDYLLGSIDMDFTPPSDSMVLTLYANVSMLQKEQGLNDKGLEEAVGLKKGFMDNLKRSSLPSVDKIVSVAEYFNVSVDFLVGRTNVRYLAEEVITAPMVAHSSTYTPAGTETYADKRAGEFANAPDVDTEF